MYDLYLPNNHLGMPSPFLYLIWKKLLRLFFIQTPNLPWWSIIYSWWRIHDFKLRQSLWVRARNRIRCAKRTLWYTKCPRRRTMLRNCSQNWTEYMRKFKDIRTGSVELCCVRVERPLRCVSEMRHAAWFDSSVNYTCQTECSNEVTHFINVMGLEC